VLVVELELAAVRTSPPHGPSSPRDLELAAVCTTSPPIAAALIFSRGG
jgi:hypothetical protein